MAENAHVRQRLYNFRATLAIRCKPRKSTRLAADSFGGSAASPGRPFIAVVNGSKELRAFDDPLS